MKIRILNGGHATIAYPAGLLGIEFVHEAMAQPLISRLSRQGRDRARSSPTVPPVPGTDLDDYRRRSSARFANPKIGDTIRRLCLDGRTGSRSSSCRRSADRLAAGAAVTGLALVSALWCRYCYGETDAGHEIAPNDPNWDRLVPAARAARATPRSWLAMADIYGATGRAEPFAAAFETALTALWSEGVERVLTRYLADNL